MIILSSPSHYRATFGNGDAASSQTVQFAADHTKYVPSCEQHPITDGGGLSSTADWRCPQVKEDLLKPLRKRLEARVVELGLVPRLVKRISGSEKVCVLGTGCKGEVLLSPLFLHLNQLLLSQTPYCNSHPTSVTASAAVNACI